MQLGPEITSDVGVVRSLMARFGMSKSKPPTNAQFLDLARLATGGTLLPNVGAVVRALSSFVGVFVKCTKTSANIRLRIEL